MVQLVFVKRFHLYNHRRKYDEMQGSHGSEYYYILLRNNVTFSLTWGANISDELQPPS